MFEAKNPERLEKTIEIGNLRGLHDVFVEGKYLYLADGGNGLVILEYKLPKTIVSRVPVFGIGKENQVLGLLDYSNALLKLHVIHS